MSQIIELVIVAETEKVAKEIFSNLEIEGLNEISCKQMGASFLLTAESSEALKDKYYKKINNNENISIINDPSSQERAKIILDEIYKVELLLRKIVLYLSKSFDSYCAVVKSQAKHYKGPESISKNSSLDPIVSHFTLGELIEFLSYETSSWCREKIVSPNDIIDLFKNSETLEDLKRLVEARSKSQIIWNIISNDILANKIDLKDIRPQLNNMKEKRDHAAHFRIVRKSDIAATQVLVEGIIKKLELRTFSNDELESIKERDEQLSTSIQNKNGGYPSHWSDAPMDTIVDDWGMYNRESSSYAAFKVASSGHHMPYWGGIGNPNQWPTNAKNTGIPTGDQPKKGSVAISKVGYYGHAMWVEEVIDNKTIKVSQYNYEWNGEYSENTISVDGLIFIYF